MRNNITDLSKVDKVECIKQIKLIADITEQETKWRPKSIALNICGSNDPILALSVFLSGREVLGLEKLREMGRVDLSLEVFVVDPRYFEHFAVDIRQIADRRLRDIRYKEDPPIYYFNQKSKKYDSVKKS